MELNAPWLSDRYELIERLGAGGMGEVWLALDREKNRTVAIKRLAVAGDSSDPGGDRIRFKREFLTLSRLEIPGIVKAFDLGETETAIFYTMEHVTGWPLRDYFRGGHYLHPEAASASANYFERPGALDRLWALGAELLRVLARLHAQGLIHRDLKPGNIMVTPDGGLRLIDFGLARSDSGEAGITRAGEVVGTPTYLAPEQLRGLPLDGRADLYAVGVVLYELAAGRPPFRGATLAEVLLAHLQQAPAPPRGINPRIDPAHNGFILRLLAKEPGGRCATAAEAAVALVACSAGSAGETLVLAAPAPLAAGGDGRLLTTPYIGNEAAREALLAACRALISGDGGALLLSGPAGAGKSRLGDEARAFGAEFGMKTISGTAHAGGALPLQLWHGVFEGIAQELQREPARVSAWLGNEAAVLAARFPALRRLPALHALPPPPPLAADGERARLFAAVYMLFATIAADHRVILRLDDLQWADPQSLQLAAHLLASFTGGGREGQPQLLVIASIREDAADDPQAFNRWLEELRGPRLERHRLAPLSPAQTGQLVQSLLGLAAPPPEKFAARLHELTGGNPYLATETLRALVQGGQLMRDEIQGWDFIGWLSGQSGVTTPGNLSGAAREAILQPLQRLDASVRDALMAASLIGPRFRFNWWQRTLGADEDAMIESADQAIRAGLLKESGTDLLAFSHELLRAALQDQLSGLRRRRLHGRILAAIAADGAEAGNAELLAHHAIEAGLREESVRYAHAAVSRLYDQGLIDAALHLLQRLEPLFPPESPMPAAARAVHLREKHSLLFNRGEMTAAAELGTEACDAARAAGDTDSEMRVWLTRAGVERRRGRISESHAAYATALELARAGGNRSVEAETQRGLGWLMVHEGRPAEARERLESAWALAREAGDESRYRQFINALAVLAYHSGDMRLTGEYSRQALELSRRLGDSAGEALESGNLGEVSLQFGRLAEAEELLHRALELNRAIGQRYALPDNYLNLAQLHALRAEWPAAERALEQAFQLGVEVAPEQRAHARLQRARMDLWRDRPDQAASQMAAAGVEAVKSNHKPVQAQCAAFEAELALYRGDTVAAHAAAAHTLELATGKFATTEILALALSAAAAALAQGACDDVAFAAVNSRAAQSGIVELQISVALLHGRSLLTAGRVIETREILAAAAARARESGMTALADEAGKLTARLQRKITD